MSSLVPYATDFESPNGEVLTPEDRLRRMRARRSPHGFGYDVGRGIAAAARGGLRVGDAVWNRHPLLAMIGTAVPAALAAGAGAWIWNKLSDRQVSPGVASAIGGGLGAGTGYYFSHLRKQASLWRQDPGVVRQLAAALQQDSSINASQKQQAISALGNLSATDLEELMGLIQTVGGAGLGALVFRFLFSKGLIPTLLGTIIGAAISRPRAQTNAFGRATLGAGGFFG